MAAERRKLGWLLLLVTLTVQSLPVYSVGSTYVNVREDCEDAWECCRFPTDSKEFDNCCLGHDCCPLCTGVSPGCCFNSETFPWGSVVESVPGACLDLVCAASLTHLPPFLTATLVFVPQSPDRCHGRPCEDVKLTCVDHTGLAKAVGDVWHPDRCHECYCLEGNRVECHGVEVRCPPRPHPSCVEVLGPCCPSWNCTHQSGCTDEDGSHHDLHTTWPVGDGKCTWRVCTLAGVEERVVTCPSKPRFNCRSIAVEGQCCPEWQCGQDCSAVSCFLGSPGKDCLPLQDPLSCCPTWNCSGCYDDTGVYHELHSSWQPDPCTTLLCTAGGVKTTIHPCPPPPHPNCQPRTRPGECCPRWICGPDCRLVFCELPPHPSCTPYKLPMACCNEWNCSVCVDERGQAHEEGSEWLSDQDPCLSFTCTNSQIVPTPVLCPQILPLHSNCFQYTPRGECCPRFNCSGCVDAEGRFRQLGSMWYDGPCTRLVCEQSGVVNRTQECPPPPHQNCLPTTLPGVCCPEWKCGPDCIAVLCVAAPDPSCTPHREPLDCCNKWDCSGCVDKLGVYHEPMSTWHGEDECVLNICIGGGTISTIPLPCPPLPLEPPHPNCLEVVPEGGCCPEWKCGTDCRLVKCASPPSPHCDSHLPRLSCCYIFNCSGCKDDEGVFHDLGTTWSPPSMPCLAYHCTPDGILAVVTVCDPAPPRPHYSCYLHTPPEKCCPVWSCSSGCVDENGQEHEEGSEWPSDQDPCLFFTCTNSLIVPTPVLCPPILPPHLNCFQYTPQGECCPRFNCSGCVDSEGRFRQLGSVWHDGPCTHLMCEHSGVVSRTQECPPPPHHNCLPTTLPEACCPEWKCGQDCSVVLCEAAPHPSCTPHKQLLDCCNKWNCSGCVDKAGVYHEPMSTWRGDYDCVMNICITGGTISTIPLPCPPLSLEPPHANCLEVVPERGCCPEWECGIDCRLVRCAGPHSPHCDRHLPRLACCYVFNCSGCEDDEGVFHELGTTWSLPSIPCLSYHCTSNGILAVVMECPPAPPRPKDSCELHTPPEECCPMWICSNGCVDETGGHHDLYSHWQSGPCIHHMCTQSGVLNRNVTCDPLGYPPHHSCTKLVPLGECCPVWDCSTSSMCLDGSGTRREVGDTWHSDACTLHRCTTHGTQTTDLKAFCEILPPPIHTCELVEVPGQCCPEWLCSNY